MVGVFFLLLLLLPTDREEEEGQQSSDAAVTWAGGGKGKVKRKEREVAKGCAEVAQSERKIFLEEVASG